MSVQDILVGKQVIPQVSDIKSGMILGQNKKGFFSVVEQVGETINHIENPSFMAGEYPYDIIDYGSRRSPAWLYEMVNATWSHAKSDAPDAYPMHGGWLKILPDNWNPSGMYYELDLDAGDYTFSCFIAGVQTHSYHVYVTDDNDEKISSQTKIKGNRSWQRAHVSFNLEEPKKCRLYLMREYTEVRETHPFYTSFWVCEDNPFLTLPFNGNYSEKNKEHSDQKKYIWLGGEWISKSVRSDRACNSGRERFLQDYGFVLEEITGLGSSGITHVVKDIPAGGGIWNTTRIGTRQFILSGQIQGRTFYERMKNESDLDKLLTSTKRGNIEQPTTLIFRVYDEKNNTIVEGQTIYIYCRFDGGIASTIKNDRGGYDVNLSFTLVDPFLYSSLHRATYLDDREEYNNGSFHNVMTKDRNDVWSEKNIVTNNKINRIIRASDKKIYIGGDFTSVNGVPDTKYMILYNELADTVKSVGVFTEFSGVDGFVSDMIALPDGRIIVAGCWEDVDGVSDSHNIAIYDTLNEEWSALGAGHPNTSFCINSISLDQMGNVYAVGTRRDGGDNFVYKCNIFSGFNWTTLGELKSGFIVDKPLLRGQKIITVNRKIDPEFVVADLYVTGRFESIDSASETSGIAKYDGEENEWVTLGDTILSYDDANILAETGDELLTENSMEIITSVSGGFALDMKYSGDGNIYIVGNFVNTENGVVSPYIIAYTGTGFKSVGLPGSYARYGNGSRRVEIDGNGNLHILLDFIYADVLPIGKNHLTLTGNTWRSVGLYTASNHNSILSDGDIYYDEYIDCLWIASRPYHEKVTFGGRTNIINNNGEVVYPKLVFAGQGELVSIYNRATNKMIDFSSYNMLNEEIVTFNLEKHGSEVVQLISNINGNISNMIGASSNINFGIVQGDNEIGFVMNNKGSETTCFATWQEKYIGIYDAINFNKII